MRAKKIATANCWSKATNILQSLSLIVSGIAVCTMVVLIVFGVFTRYVLDYNVSFAIEYTEYLLAITIFWGMTYALENKGFINVNFIFDHMPDKIRWLIMLTGNLLGFIFLIIILKLTFEFSLNNIKEGYVSMYPTATPIGYIQLFKALGIVTLLMQLFIRMIRAFCLGPSWFSTDDKKLS